MKRNHEARMELKSKEGDHEETLTMKDFEKEIELLKKKGNKKYKELTEAGQGFRMDVFDFMKKYRILKRFLTLGT